MQYHENRKHKFLAIINIYNFLTIVINILLIDGTGRRGGFLWKLLPSQKPPNMLCLQIWDLGGRWFHTFNIHILIFWESWHWRAYTFFPFFYTVWKWRAKSIALERFHTFNIHTFSFCHFLLFPCFYFFHIVLFRRSENGERGRPAPHLALHLSHMQCLLPAGS